MRLLRFGTPAWRRYLEGLPRGAGSRRRAERVAAAVVRAVRREGDAAVLRFTARFDGVRLAPAGLRVSPAEVGALAARADRDLVSALDAMARRIEAFHRGQRDRGFRIRLRDGSLLEERVAAIDSVGLYVPGGAAAYPSSVLMNAIPARVAGVPRVVVVTPPRALESSPALAAALLRVGLQGSVYRVGGAQAVAALAFGTRALPRVSKIVGPGNAYVAAAKRLVRGHVETDAEAGPSEVAILADAGADPGFVAADLLAQAEHGSGDETVVLVTTSGVLARETLRRVGEGSARIANRSAARRALRRNAAVVLVASVEEGIEAVNSLAPEHAQVMTRGADAVSKRLVAGAVFVGEMSPAAAGDYGIGPNHVLPTSGNARFASPLSVRDFQRRSSRVRLTAAGLMRVAAGMEVVARAEGLSGHAWSLRARHEAE
jgi:histidinol dehydrogenase